MIRTSRKKDHPHPATFSDPHDILMDAPIGIFTSSPQGRFLSVNPALSDMLGYESPEKLIDSVNHICSQLYADHEERENLEKLLNDRGQAANYECRWIRRDGSFIWVSNSINTVRDENGDIIHYQGFVVEAGKREEPGKNQRNSLVREKSRLQFITDAMGEGLYVMDEQGLITFANPAAASLLGYKQEELLGRSGHGLFHHHQGEKERRTSIQQCPFFQAVINGKSYSAREWFQHRDGRVFPVEVTARPMFSEAGAVIGAVTVFSDISAREEAERKLRENKQFLSGIIESIQEGISVLDADLNIRYANSFMERWYERNRPLKGKKCYQAYHDREEPCPECPSLRCMRTGKQESEVVPGLPDTDQWLEVFSHPMLDPQTGEVTGVVEFVQDITERTRLEQELREQNNLLETIINGIPDILAIQYPDHSIERYNQAGYQVLNMSPEEVRHQKCFQLIGRDRECEPCATRRALRTKEPAQLEKYVPELDLYLDCRSIPILDEQGEVVKLVEQLRDITSRKRAEEALQQSREYYRTIFETTGAAQVIIEEDTTISLANSRFEELTGYSREEIEGKKTWTEFVHPDDLEWMKVQHHLRRRDPGAAAKEYECRFIDAQGGIRHVLLSVDLIPNTTQSVASLLDITERKRNEEMLKHLSLHDQLTGLYNRAYLENELKRLNKSREHPVTIMSIDVDGLKAINDMFGHEQGDRILKLTADILQESFRASDILGRAGGDEFTALLPETDAQAGSKIVQRIRSGVEKYNREKQDTQLPLSLSTGIAVAEDRSRDLFSVFKEADDLMYRDKLDKDVTARSQIMRTIMAALEEKDFITHGHSQRLEDLCRKVGERAGLSEKQLSNLALLAQVHDLGKVGIPDHVLFKEGPLTEDEWEIMYKHPEKGYRIAKSSPDLSDVAPLILKHHERWDGEGYPLGLEGEEIPIECRILAIADAYDAITSDRPYRKALDHEDAIAELKHCSGTQFDPDLVEKFIEVIQQFNA